MGGKRGDGREGDGGRGTQKTKEKEGNWKKKQPAQKVFSQTNH